MCQPGPVVLYKYKWNDFGIYAFVFVSSYRLYCSKQRKEKSKQFANLLGRTTAHIQVSTLIVIINLVTTDYIIDTLYT